LYRTAHLRRRMADPPPRGRTLRAHGRPGGDGCAGDLTPRAHRFGLLTALGCPAPGCSQWLSTIHLVLAVLPAVLPAVWPTLLPALLPALLRAVVVWQRWCLRCWPCCWRRSVRGQGVPGPEPAHAGRGRHCGGGGIGVEAAVLRLVAPLQQAARDRPHHRASMPLAAM